MIRLVIAEDHQALIDGITLLLEYENHIKIVGTANDGEELLHIVDKYKPDVVLVDIRMPKLDGINATKSIIEKYPNIKVLAFTMFDQAEAVKQMLNAGASGYILKNSSLTEVKTAIETVAKGKTYLDAGLNTNVLENPHESKRKGPLTKRQIQILQLIALGNTSREIAEKLHIGVRTVETHRKNMVRILNLTGNGELMRYAIERKYRF